MSRGHWRGSDPIDRRSHYQVRNGIFVNERSLTLDGGEDFIKFGNLAAFNFTKDMAWSTSGWMKTSTVALMSLFSKVDLNNGWLHRVAGANTMTVILLSGGTLMRIEATATGTTDGTWHHHGMTYDGSDDPSGMKLFLDGIELSPSFSQDTLAGEITSTNEFVIGAIDNGGSPSQFVNGKVDMATVYNRAIDAEEMAYLATPLAFPPSISNCIDFWPIGENNDNGSVVHGIVDGIDGTPVSIDDSAFTTDIAA